MSRWTDFVKKFAAENNLTYGCAISKPECKATYHAKYGNRKRLTQKTEKQMMGMEDINVNPVKKNKKSKKIEFEIVEEAKPQSPIPEQFNKPVEMPFVVNKPERLIDKVKPKVELVEVKPKVKKMKPKVELVEEAPMEEIEVKPKVKKMKPKVELVEEAPMEEIVVKPKVKKMKPKAELVEEAPVVEIPKLPENTKMSEALSEIKDDFDFWNAELKKGVILTDKRINDLKRWFKKIYPNQTEQVYESINMAFELNNEKNKKLNEEYQKYIKGRKGNETQEEYNLRIEKEAKTKKENLRKKRLENQLKKDYMKDKKANESFETYRIRKLKKLENDDEDEWEGYTEEEIAGVKKRAEERLKNQIEEEILQSKPKEFTGLRIKLKIDDRGKSYTAGSELTGWKKYAYELSHARKHFLENEGDYLYKETQGNEKPSTLDKKILKKENEKIRNDFNEKTGGLFDKNLDLDLKKINAKNLKILYDMIVPIINARKQERENDLKVRKMSLITDAKQYNMKPEQYVKTINEVDESILRRLQDPNDKQINKLVISIISGFNLGLDNKAKLWKIFGDYKKAGLPEPKI